MRGHFISFRDGVCLLSVFRRLTGVTVPFILYVDAVLSDASKKLMYDAGFYDPMEEEDQVSAFLLWWFSLEFCQRRIKRRHCRDFTFRSRRFLPSPPRNKHLALLVFFVLCSCGLFQFSP